MPIFSHNGGGPALKKAIGTLILADGLAFFRAGPPPHNKVVVAHNLIQIVCFPSI